MFQQALSLTQKLSVSSSIKKKNDTQPILVSWKHYFFWNNISILSLIFDDNLSWRPHLKKLKAERQSRMNTIKILGNNTWRSDTKSLTIIHKALILSGFSYWLRWHNQQFNKKKNLNNLELSTIKVCIWLQEPFGRFLLIVYAFTQMIFPSL